MSRSTPFYPGMVRAPEKVPTPPLGHAPRGWYCKSEGTPHTICPLVPRWWNLKWRRYMR